MQTQFRLRYVHSCEDLRLVLEDEQPIGNSRHEDVGNNHRWQADPELLGGLSGSGTFVEGSAAEGGLPVGQVQFSKIEKIACLPHDQV